VLESVAAIFLSDVARLAEARDDHLRDGSGYLDGRRVKSLPRRAATSVMAMLRFQHQSRICSHSSRGRRSHPCTKSCGRALISETSDSNRMILRFKVWNGSRLPEEKLSKLLGLLQLTERQRGIGRQHIAADSRKRRCAPQKAICSASAPAADLRTKGWLREK